VLAVRAPSDVINLASVWGLGHERGKDGLTKEPRSLVEFARLKRESFQGVVDVVYGGEKPPSEPVKPSKREQKAEKDHKKHQQKRKADSLEGTLISQPNQKKQIANSEQKRNKKAKQAKQNAK